LINFLCDIPNQPRTSIEDEEIPKAQLYRQRRRNVEKVLCSLLVFNWQGDDGLAGAQLRDLNVEIGSLDLRTGETSSPATRYFLPNLGLPNPHDINSQIAKGVVTDREWLGSFEEELSYIGDLEDTNVVLPSDLRRSMDKYVQEVEQDTRFSLSER
jgi:hypothetical protein